VRVGIFVFDDAEELDVVGPFEVLTSWAATSAGHPAVVLFSADGAGVRMAKGMRILPDTSAALVGDLDVLVYPGGHGTRALMRDEDHLDWVRGLRRVTGLMTSVCTGSLVYAAAGLLAGRLATTHWASLELLAATDPSIRVDATSRFVDDGDVITSAGVSAGIDMALHLVARLDSVGAARAVRRNIEYDPQPPV
jgi:transcriptional regulator GlxA family with amidase domain